MIQERLLLFLKVALTNYRRGIMIVYIDNKTLHIYDQEQLMIKISATKLRNNLFEYLDKASKGETIVIQRNNLDVARMVPTHQTDWRDRMSIKPELRVSQEELIKSIEDVWEEYM